MQELARQEPAAPTPKMDFTTTTASAHVAYDLTGMSVGSRVMKTQDGEDISTERRDATLLAEVGVGVLPEPAAPPSDLPREAFTIDQHFREQGKATFQMTNTSGMSFGGKHAFSKPIDDCTKEVEE